MLNNAIWGNGLPPLNSIENEEVAASYMISLSPKWLRYSREQMMDDFKKIIQTTGVVENALHA